MREANHDAAFGCRQEMERIVKQIRTAWPEVKIVLRGDSGFCRNELMNWCESNGVDFVFGLARNSRLRRIIGLQMHQATVEWKQTGKPARVFTEFLHSTKKTKTGGWDRQRRVVAKAEHIDGKENPRFVVTSLSSERWAGQALYEELYCERGNMENRIKEQFSLFADRVSAETIRANQLRLYLSAVAYILVSGLRRLGLKGTELAQAQVSTIRTKLLKIGAQIRVSGQTCAPETPPAAPPTSDCHQPEARLGSVRRYCPAITPQTPAGTCRPSRIAQSTPVFLSGQQIGPPRRLSAPLFSPHQSSVRNAG
jgi:hypothetical protein